MNCPNCNSLVRNENINIQTDVAKCEQCNYVFKISENIFTEADTFTSTEPPSGTWIKKELNQTVLGASTRSPVAFFLVPFMIVWSLGAIGGIYGTQIIDGKFDLFTSLFGIPFIIGAIVFWSFALMTINGKVELTLSNEGGKVFTGFGKIGIKSEFKWKEIASISEGPNTMARYPGKQGGTIVMDGKKRISFGSGLNQARLYYVLKSLKKMHFQFKKNGSITSL
jgi:hypothetical protein